jgi:hypothetical protein
VSSFRHHDVLSFVTGISDVFHAGLAFTQASCDAKSACDSRLLQFWTFVAELFEVASLVLIDR